MVATTTTFSVEIVKATKWVLGLFSKLNQLTYSADFNQLLLSNSSKQLLNLVCMTDLLI